MNLEKGLQALDQECDRNGALVRVGSLGRYARKREAALSPSEYPLDLYSAPLIVVGLLFLFARRGSFFGRPSSGMLIRIPRSLQ